MGLIGCEAVTTPSTGTQIGLDLINRGGHPVIKLTRLLKEGLPRLALELAP